MNNKKISIILTIIIAIIALIIFIGCKSSYSIVDSDTNETEYKKSTNQGYYDEDYPESQDTIPDPIPEEPDIPEEEPEEEPDEDPEPIPDTIMNFTFIERL